MKQIAVISGKGGTGKILIASSLAHISKNNILADCDVDASNLYLVIKPITLKISPIPFYSGYNAKIDYNICLLCNKCINACKFDAISYDNVNYKVNINEILCEGCGQCVTICPNNAIKLVEKHVGECYVANTKFGTLIYSKLNAGASSSGKLVSFIKKHAIEFGKAENVDYIILDGPPGIGCPVIATLNSVDLSIVVIEPSHSSLSDARRAINLCKRFNILNVAIINKYDINLKITDQIIDYLNNEKIEVICQIPFDKEVLNAQKNSQTIIEHNKNSKTASILIEALNKIKQILSK